MKATTTKPEPAGNDERPDVPLARSILSHAQWCAECERAAREVENALRGWSIEQLLDRRKH